MMINLANKQMRCSHSSGSLFGTCVAHSTLALSRLTSQINTTSASTDSGTASCFSVQSTRTYAIAECLQEEAGPRSDIKNHLGLERPHLSEDFLLVEGSRQVLNVSGTLNLALQPRQRQDRYNAKCPNRRPS